jgi:hypothetical protein
VNEDLRKRLVERPDVPNADVDDVLEIAARRQDEARKAREGATRGEIEAVARELDIDPAHIEGAIDELRLTRAAAAKSKVEAEQARGVALRSMGIALAAAAAIGLAGTGLFVGAAWVGAGPVDEAAAATHQAEARLDVVLERQASLAPQLVSLAGGDAGALPTLAAEVRSAQGVDARLVAAEALSTEMASAIGRLPAAATEADGTLRLQLYDEIAGGQNRITTERRRYEEAEAAWRDAASGGLGGAAVGLGFAEGPE